MYRPTDQELLAFLRKVKATNAPENAQLGPAIVRAVEDVGLHETMLAAYNMFCAVFSDDHERALLSTFVSIWSTGFQMGREFEIDRNEAAQLEKLL